MRSRCTLVDRRHAERMESENRVLFASHLRQMVTLVGLAPRPLRCVFFPRKLLKSFLEGRSYRLVAGSHNRVQHCRHPGVFKSARFLVGPLKKGCWLSLLTENFTAAFLPLGTLSWVSCLNLVETFDKSP